MQLLFVCTANTCRSPMAAAIARSMGYEAESAGFCACAGEPLHEQAAAVLKKHGLTLEGHAARPFCRPLAEKADRIYVMGEEALDFVRMRYPQFAPKVLLLGEGLPDPVGREPAAFEQCFQALSACIGGLKL